MNQTLPNFLLPDVEIIGTVTCGAELFSEANILGDVNSTGALTIGKGGVVEGDITAVSVTIFGRVKGNVTVTGLCELKAQAHLLGDLKAPRLIIEDGATLIGYAEVTPSGAASLPKKVLRELPPASA